MLHHVQSLLKGEVYSVRGALSETLLDSRYRSFDVDELKNSVLDILCHGGKVRVVRELGQPLLFGVDQPLQTSYPIIYIVQALGELETVSQL